MNFKHEPEQIHEPFDAPPVFPDTPPVNSTLKTVLWRTAVAVAILILIVACFYAEENARGRHAWQKAQREIAARGESLNWNDYIPKPVPDDQNFYQAPMMTEWFVRSTNAGSGSSFYSLMANPESTTNYISKISASNYLVWSAAFDPQFNQIRDALKRPAVRLNGDYSESFLQPVPNFVNYRLVCQVLAHRAKCHLLLGEPDQALEDLTLLHHLNLTLVKSGKPVTVVAAMIHTAIAELYADAVACGLDEHVWREPELAALQAQLAEIHLLPPVAGSLQNERAGLCHLLDMYSVAEIAGASDPRKSTGDLGWWSFLPNGWIYQNKAVITTLEEQMIASVDVTNQTISPYKAMTANMSKDQALRRVTPYNFVAAIGVPNFLKAVETTGRNQTWVDQARIACALERYRLANGKYPAALADLIPRFLDKIPADVITGKPMS
jgi:hypothetical protein